MVLWRCRYGEEVACMFVPVYVAHFQFLKCDKLDIKRTWRQKTFPILILFVCLVATRKYIKARKTQKM